MTISLRHYGISARVMLLAIVPLVIMALVLGYYVNSTRNEDLRNELEQRGQLLAESMASASEFAVATGNIVQIQGTVDSILMQNDVIGVSLVDDKGIVLYEHIVKGESRNKDIASFIADIRPTAIGGDDLFEESFDLEESNLPPKSLGRVTVYISNTSYRNRQKAILTTTVLIAFAGIILSLLFALVIGRSLVIPLREIVNMVSKITDGDLSVRISALSAGEFGRLQTGINTMAERIELTHAVLEERVSDAVADLQNSVNELERKNIQLDEARKEAMQAKDAKSEFLANMSHEIRTPLNAVIGFSREIEKTTLDDEQSEYIRMINSAARQLLTVIDDILGFAKIDSGTMEIRQTDFKLRDSLEDTVLMLSQSAHEKSLEFVLLIDSDVPDYIHSDPLRINQVVTNLVNNAIKFTNEGSVVVHVSLMELDDFVRISVTDTGCGISEEAQKNLFTEFYQEDLRTSRRHSGTGLGLVICQKLVDMMGGDIGFTSVQGEGSEFFFTIPSQYVVEAGSEIIELARDSKVLLLDEHVQSRRSIRNALVHAGINTYAFNHIQKLIDFIKTKEDADVADCIILSLTSGENAHEEIALYIEQLKGLFSGRYIILSSLNHKDNLVAAYKDIDIVVTQKPIRTCNLIDLIIPDHTSEKIELSASKKPGASYQFIRALVAEDNEFNRHYINKLLDDLEIDVTCVDDGLKAVKACEEGEFDIIFLDLHMPELDGLDAMLAIRQIGPGCAHTPIVAITADVFANEGNKLTNQGFTDCMFKPLDEHRLISTIDKFCGSPIKTKKHDNKNNPVPGMDDEFMQRLAKGIYKHIAELRSDLSGRDIEAARETVHKLLGLVCYFKLDSMTELVRSLQVHVREERLDQADILISELEKEVAEYIGYA